jgi:hypothetical protein
MAPLVEQRQIRNINPHHNSITDMLPKTRYIVCKLHGNTCKELAGMAHISTTL